MEIEKLNRVVQKLYEAEDQAHPASICEVCQKRDTLRVRDAERRVINVAKSVFKKEG